MDVSAPSIVLISMLTLCSEDAKGDTISMGIGVEREAVFIAFQQYVRASTQWFNERQDGMSSILVTHPGGAAQFVPQARLLALGKLGAICALLMLLGIAPSILDPAIFQFIIHGCDLHSLHKDFIGEWHPDLKLLLSKWIAVGPNGDLSEFRYHFAAYHNMQVATLFYLVRSC